MILAMPMPPLFPFRLTPVFRRRRPPELIFAGDEQPPMGSLLTLAGQHALTALALTAYVLVAAQLGGLSGEAARSFVAVSILSMAIATFLQSWGGRLGSGSLIVHIPGPALIVFSAAAISQHGAGSMVMVGLTVGLVALLMSRIAHKLRPLFPPTIAGVVVCLVGLSLVGSSLKHSLGLQASQVISLPSLQISAVTLAIIVGVAVWGGRRLKLFGLALGLLGGVAAAALGGQLVGLEQLAHMPAFELPAIPAPVFAVDPTILMGVALAVTLGQLDVVGSVIMMQKMDDADWRRPDLVRVGRAMQAGGLANVAGAFFGGFPCALSSANIALCHVTRSTSRYIGLAAAGLLALVVFMPQVTLALTLIPTPVLGAVEIYAAAYLIVSGMQLIASRALDSRAIFTVGISLLMGVAVMLLPQMQEHAPPALHFLVGSGFIVGGFTAVVLNLVLRIGISNRATLRPEPGSSLLLQLQNFLEAKGALWGARREVVQRATLAAVEAAEALAGAGQARHLQAMTVVFDEFRLRLELAHSGPPLAISLDAGPVDVDALLDGDDDSAIDRALAGVSHVLLRRMADRIETGENQQGAWMRLHFEH